MDLKSCRDIKGNGRKNVFVLVRFPEFKEISAFGLARSKRMYKPDCFRAHTNLISTSRGPSRR